MMCQMQMLTLRTNWFGFGGPKCSPHFTSTLDLTGRYKASVIGHHKRETKTKSVSRPSQSSVKTHPQTHNHLYTVRITHRDLTSSGAGVLKVQTTPGRLLNHQLQFLFTLDCFFSDK